MLPLTTCSQIMGRIVWSLIGNSNCTDSFNLSSKLKNTKRIVLLFGDCPLCDLTLKFILVSSIYPTFPFPPSLFFLKSVFGITDINLSIILKVVDFEMPRVLVMQCLGVLTEYLPKTFRTRDVFLGGIFGWKLG